MRRLSFLILTLILTSIIIAQSPHGEKFDFNCEVCHTTNSWKVDLKKIKFDHNKTNFELIGRHKILDCQSCHNTLKFSETKSNCFDCHLNIHQNTVEQNCEQCHTSNSWVVSNITEIHELSRFPLLGAHKMEECGECHTSIDKLMFNVIGTQCIDCHLKDYESTVSPNHIEAGFSRECEDCHQVSDIEWKKGNVSHDFFPLVGGHKISNCFDCHSANTFEGLTQECFSCHQKDYNSTTNPNHSSSGFSTNCTECHSTNPNWQPASFKDHDKFFVLDGMHKTIENDCSKCHTSGFANTSDQCYDCHKTDYNSAADPVHQSAGFGTDCESCHNTKAWNPSTFDHDNQFFPIYSGEHKGEWNKCADCHTNSSNFQVFECINCHEHNQNSMNDEHSGVNGYVYQSTACFSCHPTGNKEGGFNHAATNFPLIGAHTSTQCIDCHSAGYQGTSTECKSCHLTDFQNSINPNHQQLGLEQNCEQCHTSNPDWQPAAFPVHNDFYLFEGAHISISNDCFSCHSGDYINTKNTCVGCHLDNYNNTSNPNHQSAGFGTDCETCHSQSSWQPATFDHDNQFFPIYSGKHNNQWNECSDCHMNTSNFQIFECINCHEHEKSKMDEEHSGIQGYQYLSADCYACHPTGSQEGAFNHSISEFPLTGAHINQDCSDCHQSGYTNTSKECISCHQNNFNNSLEPNHTQVGISITCEECHSTSAWKPSTFNHSTTGFELVGGHNISTCSNCHSVNTSNASAECYTCHADNYSSAPGHVQQNYPKTCQDCHNTSNWNETSFDHNKTNFVLTGAHINANCSSCHQSGYTNTSKECISCHQNNFNNSLEPNHSQVGISTTCEDCHSTSAWKPSTFNHSTTGFELVGGHNISTCSNCHSVNTSNASAECYTCHADNYSSAPGHVQQNYPKTCQDCHNTSNWNETSFDHNKTNFVLTGAHTNTNCSSCHSTGYTGTTTNCFDCHIGAFNNSSNPSHTQLGLSTNCADCHTTNPDWQPASFLIHNDFYVLEGAHSNISNNCASCHNGNYTNTPNNCYGCHSSAYNSTANPVHSSSGFGFACEDCHSQVAWRPATFDHDGQYFPIYSGKHKEEWNVCSDCHKNSNDYSIFSCIDCHEHNQTDMNNKHRGQSGYSYNSSACYNCHPNGRENNLNKKELFRFE
ncbi:MAG: hypothetical protein IPK06_13330 [Ignavibacteriae bacterium]|nr:hypothetical protein [Ignavibacteriota bacterium]